MSRLIAKNYKLLPLVRNKRYTHNYFSYNFAKEKLDQAKEVTNDISKENMEHVINQGTDQALAALNIINKKLDKETLSATVTFNVGFMQISFTSKHRVDN